MSNNELQLLEYKDNLTLSIVGSFLNLRLLRLRLLLGLNRHRSVFRVIIWVD